MKTTWHYFIYLFIIFSIALALYILYLLFIPLKPIVFYNSPFPVKTKVVKRGQNLVYTASHCKYVNTASVVSRSLVNSIQYALPSVTANVSKGCATLNIMTVTIPYIIPPGEYYLNIILTYHLNPFRDYTVNVQTEKFQVVE